MRLSPKLTWGLAWTGLALVLAVPSADFLTGQFGRGGDSAAVLTSDVEPVKTATAEPAKATKVTTIKTDKGLTIVPAGGTLPSDPVDKYLSTGKPLPDFISDGPAETQVATATPAPAAALPKMPLPVSARPAPMTAPAAEPIPVAPASTAGAPSETTTVPPVIVDESTLTGSLAQPASPVPPAAIVDDSGNWETETLRQYLERRGILDGNADDRSSATVTQRDGDYDPDGFYLSDGPNSDRTNRETRRERILRMLEENEDDGFTLF